MRSIKTVLAIFGIALLLMHSAARAQDEDWHNRGRKLLGQWQFEDKKAATGLVRQLIADGFSPTIALK